MNMICIAFGTVIVIAGILFAFRKLLPRAWKEMSESEKATVKIKALCINIGSMIAICGVILLIRGFWKAFAGKPFSIAMIAWIVACCWDVLFIARSKHYKE